MKGLVTHSMTRRNTIQKQIVLHAVNSLMNHPTADEVYCHIIESHPRISKATVYRNLNHLAEEGNLIKINVPGAADKYDASLHEHYHAICKHCNTFIDITVDNPIKIDFREPAMVTNQISDFILFFSGVCETCRFNEK